MAFVTTNHEQIKSWIEEMGGTPAIVAAQDAPAKQEGIRIDFPGTEDEQDLSAMRQSETADWNDFFRVFDAQHLAFIYDPEETDKTMSYKLIKRDLVDIPDLTTAQPFNA